MNKLGVRPFLGRRCEIVKSGCLVTLPGHPSDASLSLAPSGALKATGDYGLSPG